jgi:transposase-like protein
MWDFQTQRTEIILENAEGHRWICYTCRRKFRRTDKSLYCHGSYIHSRYCLTCAIEYLENELNRGFTFNKLSKRREGSYDDYIMNTIRDSINRVESMEKETKGIKLPKLRREQFIMLDASSQLRMVEQYIRSLKNRRRYECGGLMDEYIKSRTQLEYIKGNPKFKQQIMAEMLDKSLGVGKVAK